LAKDLSMQPLTKKYTRIQILGYLFSISIIVVMALLSCNKTTPAIFGTYRIYSDDPSEERWMIGENTYLKLNNDKTIIYNSTMNGKQRFHFEGNFTLDEKTNTLTIQWKDGKLPDKMQIQKVRSDYVIQIGTTTYKKEKTSS